MIMRNMIFCVAALLLVTALTSCSHDEYTMKNGYYSAEAAIYDKHGWKEYITICVSSNKIVMVEYDARNASGFVKSWDMDYMSTMNAKSGTYPNEYTRNYAVSLLNCQNPDDLDSVTGATESFISFQMLANAAIEQAKAGDKRVALVVFTEESENEQR